MQRREENNWLKGVAIHRLGCDPTYDGDQEVHMLEYRSCQNHNVCYLQQQHSKYTLVYREFRIIQQLELRRFHCTYVVGSLYIWCISPCSVSFSFPTFSLSLCVCVCVCVHVLEHRCSCLPASAVSLLLWQWDPRTQDLTQVRIAITVHSGYGLLRAINIFQAFSI